MSDSLVRVTRRVEWGAHRPTPGARKCRSTPNQRALPSTIVMMTSPRAFQQPRLGPPSQSASVNVSSRSFLEFRSITDKSVDFLLFFDRLHYLRGRMAKSYFKQEHDLEKRSAEAARIREKYPDRIPVIVEKAERSDIPSIDKKKYLVPADLTVGQFVYVIRKRIKLSAEKAIFIFVDNVLPPTGAIMSAIYDEKKDEDGFLYVTYSGENTFGDLIYQ